MSYFIRYLAGIYIALVVQAVFFKGVKPDLIIVLVSYYALRHGRWQGAALGAMAGLIIDTANGFILGPHILSKTLAGFSVRTVRENLFQWNYFINALMMILIVVINIFVVDLCLETFSDVSFANRSIEISLKEIIYTVVIALILYPVFRPDRELKNV